MSVRILNPQLIKRSRIEVVSVRVKIYGHNAVRVGSVGYTDFAQRSPQLSLQRSPGGTTTANRRAFDKSLQMLMQMQESEREMEEADTDASDVDASAEAQPGGTPSGTDGNPLQEPPAAAGSQEGSEDENRMLEMRGGKHFLRALSAEVSSAGVADRLVLQPASVLSRKFAR